MCNRAAKHARQRTRATNQALPPVHALHLLAAIVQQEVPGVGGAGRWACQPEALLEHLVITRQDSPVSETNCRAPKYRGCEGEVLF